jgi:two-component system response regulator NreC
VTTRILIVDDHGVLRAGLRALLNDEADLEVVGEAANGREALHQAMLLNPDVILMDISMPDISGIEATRQLLKINPGFRILILTLHEDTALLREAFRSGAKGFLLKKAVEGELIGAIRVVSGGGRYVYPDLTLAMVDEQTRPQVRVPETTLTLREIDVLRRLVKGYTNREIAEELFLSVRTVETYRYSLMSKLDLHSRVELVEYASQHGIV